MSFLVLSYSLTLSQSLKLVQTARYRRNFEKCSRKVFRLFQTAKDHLRPSLLIDNGNFSKFMRISSLKMQKAPATERSFVEGGKTLIYAPRNHLGDGMRFILFWIFSFYEREWYLQIQERFHSYVLFRNYASVML